MPTCTMDVSLLAHRRSKDIQISNLRWSAMGLLAQNHELRRRRLIAHRVSNGLKLLTKKFPSWKRPMHGTSSYLHQMRTSCNRALCSEQNTTATTKSRDSGHILL